MKYANLVGSRFGVFIAASLLMLAARSAPHLWAQEDQYGWSRADELRPEFRFVRVRVDGVVVLGGGGAGKSAVPLAGTIFREWSAERRAKDE